MKITGVDCTVLVVPDCYRDECDSSRDTVVVEVHSDEGISGIGEVDTNPWVVMIETRVLKKAAVAP